MSGAKLASGVGIYPPASALPPTADVNNNGLEGVSLQIKDPAEVRFLVPLAPHSGRGKFVSWRLVVFSSEENQL